MSTSPLSAPVHSHSTNRPVVLAVAPFAVGCVVAAIGGWCVYSEIDAKTVFELQTWLVEAFLLNWSIIFFGTFFWAIFEFQRGSLPVPIVIFGVLAILLCGAVGVTWVTFVLGEGSGSSNGEKLLQQQFHVSELMSLVIFLLFLAIDYVGYCHLRPDKFNSDADRHERAFFRRCIWIVDIPVVFIVAAVLLSRKMLFSQPGQITVHGIRILHGLVDVMNIDQPPLNSYSNMIGDSFAVGAILGHIMFSQIAFTYLKWEYYKR